MDEENSLEIVRNWKGSYQVNYSIGEYFGESEDLVESLRHAIN